MTDQYLFGVIARRPVAFAPGETEAAQCEAARVVWSGGLGALVAPYRGAPLRDLDKPRLVRLLLHHQRMAEAAMAGGSVLPVRFGTVLPSFRHVQRLLRESSRFLHGALATVAETVEVEVVATWETAQVVQQVAADPEVAALRDQLAARANVSVAERSGLGRLVKAHLDARRTAFRERLFAAVAPVARDAIANPLISDEMVFNVAFQVGAGDVDAFDDRVRQFDDACAGAISLRTIGPLPPYSFASLEIIPVEADAVAHALDVLGLRPGASQAEVRRAYRLHAAAITRATDDPAGRAVALQRVRRAADLLAPAGRERPATDETRGHSPATTGTFRLSLRRAPSDQEEGLRFGASQEAAG